LEIVVVDIIIERDLECQLDWGHFCVYTIFFACETEILPIGQFGKQVVFHLNTR